MDACGIPTTGSLHDESIRPSGNESEETSLPALIHLNTPLPQILAVLLTLLALELRSALEVSSKLIM